MADHTIGAREGWPAEVSTLLKDMGDGTHALVVYVKGFTRVAKLIDGTETSLRLDDLNDGLVTVADALYSIHQGTRYIASYLIPHGSELANDASQDFLLITGNIAPRITVSVTVGGNSELSIYENPTITNNGTTLTVRNKNRRSTNTAVAAAYHTPTVGGVGSSNLLARFIPGGTGVALVGGNAQETEWIFNTGTTYLFRLTNRSGAGILGNIAIKWDEST